MLSLGIRYLCGWAMATHPADREAAEWPPHPDRVFMALVAAHFETLGPPDERAVLEWLESQAPPMLAVPDASARRVVTSFVPVNDVSTPRTKKITPPIVEAGRAVLPEHRPRQPRQFPLSIPHVSAAATLPTTFVVWREADVSSELRRRIDGLCRKVTHVGHSASLVQMWVSDTHAEPSHVPDPNALQRLRVPTAGRFQELEHRYAAGRRPSQGMWTGYAKPASERTPVGTSVFDDSLLVFRRVEGTRLDLRSTLLVTTALRGLVTGMGPQPSPEWISGHQADGSPTRLPHLAFVPLAEVGHPHAEGRLLGAAVVVPRQTSPDQLSALLDQIYSRQEDAQRRDTPAFQLHNGGAFEWQVELALSADRAWSLRPSTWCGSVDRPSTTWATVTPIVLDRFPKREGDREEAVGLACERIGLPKPVDVATHQVSMFRGVPTASEFPGMSFKVGAPRRVQLHAILRFDVPILGPVLLGAGRHRGYGLCRPFEQEPRS